MQEHHNHLAIHHLSSRVATPTCRMLYYSSAALHLRFPSLNPPPTYLQQGTVVLKNTSDSQVDSQTAQHGAGNDLSGCVRTENARANKVCSIRLLPHACVLGHRNHGLQGVQSLTEHLALLHQGNLLLHRGPEAEELAHFIEGSTEA